MVFQPVHRARVDTVATLTGAEHQPIRAASTNESIPVSARVAPRYSAGDANPQSVPTPSTIEPIRTTTRVAPIFTATDALQTRHFVVDSSPRIPYDE